MKIDINLMREDKLNKNHLIITALILFVLIISISFILPIEYKKSLIAEKEKTSQQLAYISKTNSEYRHLKEQLISLSRQLEIHDQIEARKKDFNKILETVDDSISHAMDLTHISITGQILTVQGFAPNDKMIANFILKLQENPLIEAVSIQEIILDQDKQSRNFHIECLIQLPVPHLSTPYIEDISLEEEEEVEDFN